MRLLHHVGHTLADQSLAAWLAQNSPQLEALTLAGSYVQSNGVILTALADAAAAAQAAGRPLQLHTLRVVGLVRGYVYIHTIGRLLAGLPRLRCLQLGMCVPCEQGSPVPEVDGVPAIQQLSSLHGATQLQELYLMVSY
jgi:hypothetical protein